METKHRRITQAEYDTHDCHAGPDDGCEVCEQYEWEQAEQVHEMEVKMKGLQISKN